MPRTILTDAEIEKKCPEYQPLGFPNAYFDNVGGFYKSEGIKPTPVRPPPRPARIQYLSANANLELEKVRQAVDTSVELAQPLAVRVAERVRATAPPFEVNLLAGTPPPYSTGVAPPTYQEGREIGIPPPIFEEVLEEKEPIPMVQPFAVGRTTIEGEPSFAPETQTEAVREAQETITLIQNILEEKEPTKHIIDHTTSIDKGVEIRRAQTERLSMLGEESLSRMRETEDIQKEELEKLAPEIASEELRLQALEEAVRLAEQLPAEAQTRVIQQLELIQAERMEEQKEISLAETRSLAELTQELEKLAPEIVSEELQRVQRTQLAQQVAQGAIQRGTERVAKQKLEQVSALENVGVSGLQQPSREEAQMGLEKIGKKALRKQEERQAEQEVIRGKVQRTLSRFGAKVVKQQVKYQARKQKELEEQAKMTVLEQRLAGLKLEEGRAELTRRREELSDAPTPRTGALQARLKELESFVIPAQFVPELQTPEYQAIKETMRGKQRLRGAKKAELYNPFRTEF